MLGYSTTVDDAGNVTYGGQPDEAAVTQFINDSTTLSGDGIDYLSGTGFNLLNQAMSSEIDNAFEQGDDGASLPSNVGEITDDSGGTTVYIAGTDGEDVVDAYTSAGSLASTSTIGSDGTASSYSFDAQGDVTDYSALNADGTSTRISLTYNSDGSISDGTFSSYGDGGNSLQNVETDPQIDGEGESSSSPTDSPDGGPPIGSGDAGSAADDMGDGNNQADPLVLDLTGNGFDLTALSPVSPYYDFTGTGLAAKTGWIGIGSGFLVLDTGAQGAGIQLFGSSPTGGDGFASLAALDTNYDGQITSSDSEWSDLRVWVDANGNGVLDPDELFTLSQLGITSISLSYSADGAWDQGNEITSIASYTLSDGTKRAIADIALGTSPTYTRADSQAAIPATIAALPEISGFGTLTDLQSAMTSNSTLEGLVQSFANLPTSTSSATIDSDAQSIMYSWGGVSKVGLSSRGDQINARQLEFAEKYTGIAFTQYGGDPQILQAAFLNQAWTNLQDGIEARLVLQTSLSADVPEFTYNAAADFVLPNVSLGQSFADALSRLGAPTKSNIAQWDLEFRVADAYRMDAHLSQASYVSQIAAATNDTIASLANALATNQTISFKANGTITETGNIGGNVFYAAPGISQISSTLNFFPTTPIQDSFVYNPGDGTVLISESDSIANPKTLLIFGAGIAPTQITVATDSDQENLYLTDGTQGDRITLVDELSNSGVAIQQIQFANGTTWSAQQLIDIETTGTAGADMLYGSPGGDVFDGKGAPSGSQDYEQGNGGGDTFIYNQGYGDLEIDESDYSSSPNNALKLGAGITTSQVVVTGDIYGDVLLTDGTSGDQIILDNELNSSTSGVQQIQFANGTTWSAQQLIDIETTGTAGADMLYGSPGGDVFDGKGAPSGSQDYEQGNGGGDTFIYNQGYGDLEIDESDYSSSPNNALKLGAGITTSQVVVTGDIYGDVLLTDGTSGDQIILDNELNSSTSGVQQIQFANGTTWSAQQLIDIETTGTAGADMLYGSPGGDVFDGKGAPSGSQDYEQGNGGGDTFIYNQGYGDLEIDESDYSSKPSNVLELGAGIQHADVIATKLSADSSVVLTIGNSGDQVTLDEMLSGSSYGVQSMQFSDGTTWSAKMINTLAKTGTTGANTINGTTGNDVFDGRGGTDTINGAGGDDTYLFRSGYGHLTINNSTTNGTGANGEIDFGAGLTEKDLWFSNVSGDLNITAMGSQDSVTVKGWFGANQSAQLASIVGYDGTRLTSGVSNLVSAMSAYSSSHSGFNPATAIQMPTDPALQSALSAAWHT